ncbi:MAG TPA: alpha/beta hydrolase-fold protein [Kofleriaceae bacterium]|jgi:predicted alpha/beta superfamily hydrolase|nr:alpha/beta hydrolase-fold protein [Kofleriaceae bacterium]
MRAAIVIALAGCSAPHATPATPDASLPDAATASIDAASGDAIVRVHYPMAGHAMTIRGGGAGLAWTSGVAMIAAGTDTVEFDLHGLAAAIEWKPLLDDATWARGPNYHVAPGDTLEIYPHFTATAGQVVTLIADFHSAMLNDDRAIYAYLPASYAENSDATYPVVYMHDGQNLWAALPQLAFSGTWNADTAFDTATEQGTCSGWGAQPLGGAPALCNGDGDCASGTCRTFPEAIVIGVANTTDRIYEYTPTTDPTTPGGGGADAYLAMLALELKPAIDAQLRTQPQVASTLMAGSSLGGLVTAYAGTTHADVFGKLAELSPSTWWNTDVIVGDVAATPAAPRPQIVYVDSGQGDVDDESDTDQLATAYLQLGYIAGENFRHVVQPNAQHDETYWAQRFPGAMQLVLGDR